MAERKPQAIPVSLTESADKKSVVWTKNIVEYDFMQYLSGKKLTAAEWNMLLVRIVQQGNYTADSLKEFIEVNLHTMLEAYDTDIRGLIGDLEDLSTTLEDENGKTLVNALNILARAKVDAVPKRLNEFQRIDTTTNTAGFRTQAFVYVDKDNQSFRMSLQDIKNLNTKIVAATRTNEVNTSELSVDDYIFSKE